jgi:hypothetical protein
MIKVHMRSGAVHEGSVFSVDPVTNTVVLKNPDDGGGYLVLFSGQIANVEGEIPAVLSNELPNLALL